METRSTERSDEGYRHEISRQIVEYLKLMTKMEEEVDVKLQGEVDELEYHCAGG